MSRTNQFWEYAEEAILSACKTKTGKETQDLLALART